MPRALASLTVSFGLVAIPVKLYAATEAGAAIRFKLMTRDGGRVRQQYVADADVGSDEAAEAAQSQPPPPAAAPPPAPAAPAAVPRQVSSTAIVVDEADIEDADPPPSQPIARAELVKGYEYEKGRWVTFTAAELKALEDGARQTIDIVAFVPTASVDPVYYDRAYYLGPDRRGAKPYALLLEALRRSGRSALAKWAWRGKETVVQIRPGSDGLVLQQLLYAEEVRPQSALAIENAAVGTAELELALALIGQHAQDAYDPTQYVDEERRRILAAVERKVAGRMPAAAPTPAASGSAVVDLVQALRASLAPVTALPARKPARRAAAPVQATAAAAAAAPTVRAKRAAGTRPASSG